MNDPNISIGYLVFLTMSVLAPVGGGAIPLGSPRDVCIYVCKCGCVGVGIL